MESEYFRESSARQRFEAAVSILRTKLNSGEIASHVINKSTGKSYIIPQEHWAKENITDVFEMGHSQEKWKTPNIYKFLVSSILITNGFYNNLWAEGSVYLKEDDVVSLLQPKKSEKKFLANANRKTHKEYYEIYHKKQVRKFLDYEITWPSISQVEEEKLLKEKMKTSGYNLNRELFNEVRNEILIYMPNWNKTKKSKKDIDALRCFLLEKI